MRPFSPALKFSWAAENFEVENTLSSQMSCGLPHLFWHNTYSLRLRAPLNSIIFWAKTKKGEKTYNLII
jgi:hypothetical protein